MQCVLHLTSSKERNVDHLNQNIMKNLLLAIVATVVAILSFFVIGSLIVSVGIFAALLIPVLDRLSDSVKDEPAVITRFATRAELHNR